MSSQSLKRASYRESSLSRGSSREKNELNDCVDVNMSPGHSHWLESEGESRPRKPPGAALRRIEVNRRKKVENNKRGNRESKGCSVSGTAEPRALLQFLLSLTKRKSGKKQRKVLKIKSQAACNSKESLPSCVLMRPECPSWNQPCSEGYSCRDSETPNSRWL